MKKVLFLILISFVFAQNKGPEITIKKNFYNFGDIKEGDVVSYEYTIENTGDDLLIINEVRASCGCTAVQPEKRRLLPKEKIKLKVEFDSMNRKGAQTKYVYIMTNDPKNSQSKVSFSANILEKSAEERAKEDIPIIQIEKNYLNLGTKKSGEKVVAEINVKNTGRKELIIKEVKSTCDCIVGEMTAKRIKQNDNEKLKIYFDTKGLTGKISRSIVLITNDKYNPYNYITIFVDIEN